MTFRYDMQGKSPQQQEIVRKNDEAENKSNEAREKKKVEEFQNGLTYEVAKPFAAYQGILIKNDKQDVLTLGITIATLFNEQSGLNENNINDWLFEVGKSFAHEIKDYKVLVISAADVMDKKLITSWKNLQRIEEKQS